MEEHVMMNIARAILFIFKKSISKKLILDINLFFKRGKLATKSLSKLLHHHHNHHNRHLSAAREYEFSCSNTPAYTFPNLNKNKYNFFNFACVHAPPTLEDDPSYDASTVNAVVAAMEMLNNEMGGGGITEAYSSSPVLPGFGYGRSPFVRPLRITDSPFPLRDVDDDNGFVDKAAEEFIQRFYRDLKNQK